MKRILLMTVAFVATLTVAAQTTTGKWSVRPAFGMTISNVYGDDADGTEIVAGLAGGAEVGYQVSPAIGLSLGAYLMQQGCQKTQKDVLYRQASGRSGFTNVTATERNLYLNVPLLANVYVVKGLALKTGLQIGWLLKANLNTKALDVSVDVDALRAYKTIDLSLPVGASYEYENVVFDVRYNFGLVNIGKTDYIINGQGYHDEHNHIRNGCLLLTIGYLFNL